MLPFRTQNFDRNIQPCYALGEYLNVKESDGKEYVLWGDSRDTITEPMDPLDPISGQTHPKENVFLEVLNGRDK